MFYIGSNKITPGLFSRGTSSGDEVTAYNYTGMNISAGDKVWLKIKADISASKTTVGSNSNAKAINRSGTSIIDYTEMYDINSGTSSSANAYVYPQRMPVIYTANGGMYWKNYKITDIVSDINMCRLDNNYALSSLMSSSGYTLYRLDSNDSILKQWSVTGLANDSYSYYVGLVIGDKLYLRLDNNSSNFYTGTIDENSDTITMTSSYDYSEKHLFYTTLDNKLIITMNGSYGTSYNEWNGKPHFYRINNDNTIGTEFTSSNTDLNNLLTDIGNYSTINFNKYTGILCIGTSSYGSSQFTDYKLFKYENDDFTTITLLLDNPPTNGQRYVSVSDDMSKVVVGNVLYNLAQTADGTYKAIPYTYGMGSETVTGIAKTNANELEQFTAITVLPH